MIKITDSDDYTYMHFQHNRLYITRGIFRYWDITDELEHVYLIRNNTRTRHLADQVSLSMGGAVTAGLTGLLVGTFMGRNSKANILCRLYFNEEEVDIETNDKKFINFLIPYMHSNRERRRKRRV